MTIGVGREIIMTRIDIRTERKESLILIQYATHSETLF